MTPVKQDPNAIAVAAPKLALVFSGLGDNLTSVARHDIADGRLQVGTVVAPEDLLELVLSVLEGRGGKPKSELLPANVLVNSNDKLVWYQPSRIAPFWHVTNGERCGFKIKWPAMVFAVSKLSKQFRCVALASDERPDANSPVYNLPMPNAYHGGGFCLGNATLPREISLSTMAGIESCVYDAVKTHSNNSQAIKGGETPTSYWNRKAKARPKTPPSITKRDLTKIGLLGSWLASA